MSRREERKIRRDTILGLTVNQYIRTVSPVSSKFIAQQSRLDLSPATIRNILAELEEDGYLTHPHTSAGRVPTQKGYRYYVDYLMREIQLLEDEKARIKSQYQKATQELEELLDKTSEVLSNTTHYTSIVSIEGGNQIFLRGTNFVVDYPDYQDVRKIRDILAALERKEQLLEIINKDLAKKIDILIGHEMAYSKMENCSMVISEFRLREARGRIAILGPTRMDYERVVSALEYFSNLFEQMD
ncbi:MAG: hypothetical protein KC684_07725 [Candidatus Omnitrophica bacterium]|nr:hypothetical protein [Candidatus Omnitrophota bacterium]